MKQADSTKLHYHVSFFKVGYLNDWDAGPFDTAEDAKSFANDIVQEYRKEFGEKWRRTKPNEGQVARWQSGTFVVAAESCDFPRRMCEVTWNGE